MSGSYSNTASSFFFRFGGGLPLHSVHSLVFCVLAKDLAFGFAIFAINISYRAFMCILLLPGSNYCPDVHAQMLLFVVVLSFLKSRGPLPPGYFIPILSAGLFQRFSLTGSLEAFILALSLV
jgi:hypothetical protein